MGEVDREGGKVAVSVMVLVYGTGCPGLEVVS